MTARFGFTSASVLGIAAFLCAAANADTLTLMSPNPEVGGFFGTSVSSIPDLDGDGIDDVIVGAAAENGGATTDSGRVYIFSGKTGALIRTHASPNPTNTGHFGTCVAGIPDLTGDGMGDYIVGAPDENTHGGRVYVYNGATGALIRTHTSPNNENFGEFGGSVAGIPDLTGDGKGDYIVGAPSENSQKGRAYVFSGSNGVLWRTHTSPNAEVSGKFGYSVAAVPDLNNDNRGDYVIGAPYEGPGASPSGAGRAYVWDGLTGGPLFTLKSSNEEGSGFFGWSVAGVPDVGGNGSGDILVGAPYESVTVNSVFNHAAGRAYLFSGTTGNLGHVYQQPDADVAQDNHFGYALDGMADRDGDNLGEVVIAAIGSYDVYVYKGTGTFAVLEHITSPDQMGINQFFGSAIAGMPNGNGDGKGDYIVGGPGSDDFPNDPSQNGRAWIHRSTIFNDGCLGIFLTTLNNGANAFSNIGTAGTGNGSTSCTQHIGSDIWFTYTATCNGSATFSTCGSADFDTIIAVYQGCTYSGFPIASCNLTADPIACDDDFNGCSGFTSKVTVPCNQNDCFFVRLGGYNGAEGTGTLNVTCSCVGDLNGDGVVNGADLGLLIGNWANAGIGDLNGDNVVNGADLGLLIGHWGPC